MIWADLLRCAKTAVPLGLVAAFALMAQTALAVVTIPTPGGWSNRVPIETRERVDGWAAQAGGRTSSIISTNAADDYAEVIAVIDMPGAMPPAAMGEGPPAQAARTAALLYDAQALLGIESSPDRMGRVELDTPGAAVVHARWTLEDEAFLLALVPTGRSHAAIIMAVESRSQVLYESAFDELLWQVEGAMTPREPFPRTQWLVTAVICWTIAALLATFVVARIGPQLRPRTIAAHASVVLGGAGIVVGTIVYLTVAGRARELASVGVSPAWLALEVAGFGFGLAVATLLLGATWDRRRRPVS
ncbi:MAG: hypothetical protein JKY37_04165, partial [Nannocystaceae bacterium]|nr:hypothetical protein [Nannocystaceae bacterium]